MDIKIGRHCMFYSENHYQGTGEILDINKEQIKIKVTDCYDNSDLRRGTIIMVPSERIGMTTINPTLRLI